MQRVVCRPFCCDGKTHMDQEDELVPDPGEEKFLAHLACAIGIHPNYSAV